MSARREASKRLGKALEIHYEDLVNAVGEQEIAQAAVLLGACFNEHIEQIIWFLKEYGGVEQMPLPKLKPKLPTTPKIFS